MSTEFEDEYERWMNSPEEPDYSAMFGETLGTLELIDPVTLGSESSVADAVATMNRHSIGCILIVDDGKLEGIFTERDVLTRVAPKDMDQEQTSLATVMTHGPECLTVDDPVVHALNAMIAGGYRHVPILKGSRPVGVFGMRSCVRYIVEMHPDAVLNAPPPGVRSSFRPEGG